MINMREHVQKIVVLMAKQFINMLKVKQLINCGQTINDVTNKMHMNPYVVRKISKQINKFSLEELKKIVERLAEMDVMIKSGKIKDRLALELFIVSVL
jgi:DNA polymerase-3 subunit delta